MFNKKQKEQLTRINETLDQAYGPLRSISWTLSDILTEIQRKANTEETLNPILEEYYKATDKSQRIFESIELLTDVTKIVVTDKAYLCTTLSRNNGQKEFISYYIDLGEHYSIAEQQKLTKYNISISETRDRESDAEFSVDIYKTGPVEDLVTRSAGGNKQRILTRIEICMDLRAEEPFYNTMLGFAVSSFDEKP